MALNLALSGPFELALVNEYGTVFRQVNNSWIFFLKFLGERVARCFNSIKIFENGGWGGES